MGTDPSRKAGDGREVLAGILMLAACDRALNDFIGLLGGCVASVFLPCRLNAVEFPGTRAINALDFADIMQGMMKPLVLWVYFLATVGCLQKG